MRVRCIIELSGLPGIAGPLEGEVYAVRELRRGLYQTWAVGFTLEEIKNKVEPPPVFQGDVYAANDLPRVPTTLREAIDELERSDFAREAFGEDVVEHYLHFLKTEQRKFDEVVTSWERERYFERA